MTTLASLVLARLRSRDQRIIRARDLYVLADGLTDRPMRYTDQTLQRLRKRGEITYSSAGGWHVVESVDGMKDREPAMTAVGVSSEDPPVYTLRTRSGEEFTVSGQDYERVRERRWSTSRNGDGRLYIVSYVHGTRQAKQKYLRLHRFIMNAPDGVLVDHINGDGLDNRRENLRLASVAQNAQNSLLRSDNKSGVKNVFWAKNERKWHVKVGLGGRYYSGGYYRDLAEAEQVSIYLREKLHAEFACNGHQGPKAADCGVVLHHIDGDPTNNDPANLRLVDTRCSHGRPVAECGADE